MPDITEELRAETGMLPFASSASLLERAAQEIEHLRAARSRPAAPSETPAPRCTCGDPTCKLWRDDVACPHCVAEKAAIDRASDYEGRAGDGGEGHYPDCPHGLAAMAGDILTGSLKIEDALVILARPAAPQGGEPTRLLTELRARFAGYAPRCPVCDGAMQPEQVAASRGILPWYCESASASGDVSHLERSEVEWPVETSRLIDDDVIAACDAALAALASPPAGAPNLKISNIDDSAERRSMPEQSDSFTTASGGAPETAQLDRCTIPPAGWFCTRTPGHDGPCAAYPETRPLGELVQEWHDDLRDILDDPSTLHPGLMAEGTRIAHGMMLGRIANAMRDALESLSARPAEAPGGETLNAIRQAMYEDEEEHTVVLRRLRRIIQGMPRLGALAAPTEVKDG